MQLRSLAELASYARYLADAEGETARERHPDVDVYRAVNRGLSRFRRELSNAGGGDRLLHSVQVATNGLTTSFPLPVDFASLWSLELGPNSYGGTDWLGGMDAIESADLRTSQARDAQPRYRILGTNLEMLPAPLAGRTLRIWYVPSSSDLVGASDMVESFEEYVALFAASEMATSDRAFDLRDRLRGDMAALVPDIKKLARKRNMAGPSRVADTWGQRTRSRRRYF